MGTSERGKTHRWVCMRHVCMRHTLVHKEDNLSIVCDGGPERENDWEHWQKSQSIMFSSETTTVVPFVWIGVIRPHHRDESWSASLLQTFFAMSVGTQIPAVTLRDAPLGLWLQEVRSGSSCGSSQHVYGPLGSQEDPWLVMWTTGGLISHNT